MEIYLRMMLVDGFFHADPHPGNIFVFQDGTLGLVDWGMTALLTRSAREGLSEIFIAIVNQDVERLSEEICHLGMVDEESDLDRFRRDLAKALDRYFYLSRDEFPLAQVLQAILELTYEHRIQLPAEIPMLIKVLVTTEGTCMALDPNFELKGVFEPLVHELVGAKLEPGQMLRDLTTGLRTVSRTAQDLPRQVSAILNRLERGTIVVRTEPRRMPEAIQGLDAPVHRLAAALLFSALLLAGALVYGASRNLGLVFMIGGAMGAGALLVAMWRGGRR
jgi:ubiquinone biosynthesis protein